MLLIPPALRADLGKVVSIVLRPWFEASMTDTRQPLKYDEFSSQDWEAIIYFRCSTGLSAKSAVAGASGDFGDPFWTAAFTMVCVAGGAAFLVEIFFKESWWSRTMLSY